MYQRTKECSEEFARETRIYDNLLFNRIVNFVEYTSDEEIKRVKELFKTVDKVKDKLKEFEDKKFVYEL